MATPRLGLVVEDKPTELSCMCRGSIKHLASNLLIPNFVPLHW